MQSLFLFWLGGSVSMLLTILLDKNGKHSKLNIFQKIMRTTFWPILGGIAIYDYLKGLLGK